MRVRLDSSLTDDAGWTTPLSTCDRVLRCEADGVSTRIERGEIVESFGNPSAALRWLDANRSGGRWVGFLGYELGRWFEPRATLRPHRPTRTPLFAFGQLSHSCDLTGRGRVPPASDRDPLGRSYASNFTRDAYLAAVRRCIEYIAAGDVFQINLSQRLSLPYAGNPDDLYAALLAETPATYGGLIELGDVSVVSNSPELFLRVTPDRRALTRPIKGTRPNQPGMLEELHDSAKDAAELNMIVDLERNDLGRVCETGSVVVSQPRAIEEHPSVLHGVATIEGNLRDGVGLLDVLAATFPSGSVTGAPKIRAMQIIDELEPDARGVYCGAVGHLDPDGSMQFNVAIRTATLANGVLEIPVGGGIVADSDPAAEFDETLVKAAALLAAAGAG